MTTFGDLVAARADDDSLGLLFGRTTALPWRELVTAGERRGALAADLRRPGPWHVGVMLENVPDFLYWLAGCALSGATLVGVNTTRRGAELASDIRHTDCQLLVTDRAHLPLLAGLDTGVPPERVLVIDDPSYEERIAAVTPCAGVQPGVRPDDLLMLMFTSGSTGAPKAVVCTSGRLARIAETSAGMFGIARDQVCYEAMPLFHGNAIMTNIAPAVATGATVAMRRTFSASGFLPDVRYFAATYFNYVGRALAYILATPPSPEDRDNRLRLGFGTEATPQDRERFTARFGCPLVESYGSSEGGIAIVVTGDTPPGSLGRPRDTPDQDVVIADPHTSAECARARFDSAGMLANGGEAIGEIVNRAGAPSFEGYYNNPSAAAERVRDGWYWSGDLGYRDEAGWFYFAGRGADRLRVDSENLAAAPIERILERHPSIAVAAVYPVPDPRTGDQVMAAVELVADAALTPSALASFLAAQPDLGTKGAPRFVRVLAAMPVTANGKLAKASLRRDGWRTPDTVYWRPDRALRYVPFDDAAAESLLADFRAHDRLGALAAG